jgi:hypothetical protein
MPALFNLVGENLLCHSHWSVAGENNDDLNFRAQHGVID